MLKHSLELIFHRVYAQGLKMQEMNEYLLAIVCKPAQEEIVIDWLLTREGLTGFTSMSIDGHGVQGAQLSLSEQVTGRQRCLLFQIHAQLPLLKTLIQTLKEDFAGTGLHYWLTPLLEAGHL